MEHNRVWVTMDTGASGHFFTEEACKYLVRKRAYNIEIIAANGGILKAEVKGDVEVSVQLEDGQEVDGVLHEATGVPEIEENLYSIHQGVKQGNTFHFSPEGCYMQLKGRSGKIPIVKHGSRYRMLLTFKGKPKRTAQQVRACKAMNAKWHRRSIHSSHKYSSIVATKGLVKDFNYDATIEPECACGACVESTAAEASFKQRGIRRSKLVGGRLHGDIKGEVRTDSLKYKSRYCFFAIDDYCRYKQECYLQSIEDIHHTAEQAIDDARQQGHIVRFFRLDNAFRTDAMDALFKRKKIRPEYSPPRCQSSNGVSERSIRTWFKMIRAALHDQQRPKSYWQFAGQCATYIQNRWYNSSYPGAVPAETWFGDPVSAKYWRVPLCDVWFFRDKEERDGEGDAVSLEDQRTKGVLVGYSRDSTCYLCYCPERNHVYRRRYEDCITKEQSKYTGTNSAYYDVDAEDVPAIELEKFEKEFAEMISIPAILSRHEKINSDDQGEIIPSQVQIDEELLIGNEEGLTEVNLDSDNEDENSEIEISSDDDNDSEYSEDELDNNRASEEVLRGTPLTPSSSLSAAGYYVRQGDNVKSIRQRFNMTLQQFKSLNAWYDDSEPPNLISITDKSRFQKGTSINVPVEEDLVSLSQEISREEHAKLAVGREYVMQAIYACEKKLDGGPLPPPSSSLVPLGVLTQKCACAETTVNPGEMGLKNGLYTFSGMHANYCSPGHPVQVEPPQRRKFPLRV